MWLARGLGILLLVGVFLPILTCTNSKYQFYTRADWGAVPPKNVVPLRTPVPYVVIHHTYIPAACYDKTTCCKDMRAMQKYHNSLGWGDIGYNFCVGSEGGAYEGRGWTTKGIHAGRANGRSIGICLIGDWSGELQLYSRADWGADPSKGTTPLTAPVPYVIISHTNIPPVCTTKDDCVKTMKEIQDMHLKKGWDDIGYNFCVGGDGGVYVGRGWQTLGALTAKANSKSIGICFIGDWRAEVPPANQLEAAKELIAQGVKDGYVSPDYKLIGASQATNTDSPGAAHLKEISTWPNYSADEFEP